MDVPQDKQYENLTTHLRYLNEKIIEAFSLFIKLATGIIAGVFYIHLNLSLNDPRRAGISLAANAVLTVVGIGGIGIVVMIVTNLLSWKQYRKMLTKEYPAIPPGSRFRWWVSEALICVLIAATCIGFWFLNPI